MRLVEWHGQRAVSRDSSSPPSRRATKTRPAPTSVAAALPREAELISLFGTKNFWVAER
jgi:hypothetical protein